MIAASDKNLQFKRTVSDETLTSLRKINISQCGRYRISVSHCKFGPPPKLRIGNQWIANKRAIPDVVRAEFFSGACWLIISSHKKRRRAKAACQAHYRKNQEKEV